MPDVDEAGAGPKPVPEPNPNPNPNPNPSPSPDPNPNPNLSPSPSPWRTRSRPAPGAGLAAIMAEQTRGGDFPLPPSPDPDPNRNLNPNPSPNPSPSRILGPAPGPWACGACTFENSEFLPSCEMCGTARPRGVDEDLALAVAVMEQEVSHFHAEQARRARPSHNPHEKVVVVAPEAPLGDGVVGEHLRAYELLLGSADDAVAGDAGYGEEEGREREGAPNP